MQLDELSLGDQSEILEQSVARDLSSAQSASKRAWHESMAAHFAKATTCARRDGKLPLDQAGLVEHLMQDLRRKLKQTGVSCG